MKIRAFSFALLLLIPSLTVAQSSKSRTLAAANRSWPSFIAAFRVAVNARDRTAMRRMIAIPFLTQVDGEMSSTDKVLEWLDLDDSDMWKTLQKEARSGAKPNGLSNRGRPQRCTAGIFCFEFMSNGHWGLSMQGENETSD